MLILSRYSWWLGAMLALALALALAGQVGVLSPFQSGFLRLTSPVEKGLSATFEPVASFLSDAGRIRELQDENRRLVDENEALLNRIAELEGDAQRVQELEAALGIVQELTDDDLVPANVVGHDRSPLKDVISIDKGSSSGIETGMVVLSSRGTVIGTVTRVTGGRSFIRLISDSESRVNAQIQETQIEGIVKGSANRQIYLDYAQAEIKPGDHVVTSGLGGNYPPGRLIGIVSEVSGSPQDLYKTVKIEPAVRLGTVRTVLVLTSFTPERSSLVAP